jgi:hypothetical protein
VGNRTLKSRVGGAINGHAACDRRASRHQSRMTHVVYRLDFFCGRGNGQHCREDLADWVGCGPLKPQGKQQGDAVTRYIPQLGKAIRMVDGSVRTLRGRRGDLSTTASRPVAR